MPKVARCGFKHFLDTQRVPCTLFWIVGNERGRAFKVCWPQKGRPNHQSSSLTRWRDSRPPLLIQSRVQNCQCRYSAQREFIANYFREYGFPNTFFQIRTPRSMRWQCQNTDKGSTTYAFYVKPVYKRRTPTATVATDSISAISICIPQRISWRCVTLRFNNKCARIEQMLVISSGILAQGLVCR